MAAHPAPPPGARPRVPAHAWTWLQRSRPVLAEIARQLYGTTPDPGLLERLKQDYATDLFVQDLVARVVCEVAFNDRVPDRRPPGARWDRGLTWWAAHLAGVSVQEFEARSQADAGQQAPLFGPLPEPPPSPPPPRVRTRPVSLERRALVRALKELLAAGDGEQVPASAIRQLIAQLQDDDET